MFNKEYEPCLIINKINENGFIGEETNWSPFSDDLNKEKLEIVRKWVKENFKKTKDIKPTISSNILYSLFLKENEGINISKGLFLYSFFQENYSFFKKDVNGDTVVFFNIKLCPN